MSTFLQMIASNPHSHSERSEESRIPAHKTDKILHSVQDDMRNILSQIGLHDNFLQRFLNEGFSGGEKKKSELLQLIARKPKIAICDEIDSGLDLDALKSVARILRSEAERDAGLLLISHSPRLFELLPPDFVHVLLKGKLVASGGKEIFEKLERGGYKEFE